jgi:hypothetical protein
MFAWKVKELFKKQATELVRPTRDLSSINRRAINLIPVAYEKNGHEVAQTKSVRVHHLLISIEGKQRTCCLKVISPRKKSRSALLIYRGRVLGCLYGSRNAEQHLMSPEAHRNVLADLAAPGNILDAYQLPEDLVLASASLFSGQVLQFKPTNSAQEQYQMAIQQVSQFEMPGCVVISNEKNETVCMVYLAAGKVIAVYSSEHGWVESSATSGLRYLSRLHFPSIMASILPVNTSDDVAHFGFSLTGLADRRVDDWKMYDAQQHLSSDFGQLRVSNSDQAITQVLPQAHPYTPAPRRIQMSRRVQHAHSICP